MAQYVCCAHYCALRARLRPSSSIRRRRWDDRM